MNWTKDTLFIGNHKQIHVTIDTETSISLGFLLSFLSLFLSIALPCPLFSPHAKSSALCKCLCYLDSSIDLAQCTWRKKNKQNERLMRGRKKPDWQTDLREREREKRKMRGRENPPLALPVVCVLLKTTVRNVSLPNFSRNFTLRRVTETCFTSDFIFYSLSPYTHLSVVFSALSLSLSLSLFLFQWLTKMANKQINKQIIPAFLVRSLGQTEADTSKKKEKRRKRRRGRKREETSATRIHSEFSPCLMKFASLAIKSRLRSFIASRTGRRFMSFLSTICSLSLSLSLSFFLPLNWLKSPNMLLNNSHLGFLTDVLKVHLCQCNLGANRNLQ